MRLSLRLLFAALLAGGPILAACERQAPVPSQSLVEARQAMRAACKGANTDAAACEAARRKLQEARAQGRGMRGQTGMLRMGTRLGMHAMRMHRRGGF